MIYDITLDGVLVGGVQYKCGAMAMEGVPTGGVVLIHDISCDIYLLLLS